MELDRPIRLHPTLRHYAWGKRGSDSIIAGLVKLADANQPLAEMWIGSTELPFLLKVLSIGRPLSIQVHPNKQQAALLHQKDPTNYPDANHKPEIGVAVKDTALLYGFRSLAEIQREINGLAPLRRIWGTAGKEIKDYCRTLFSAGEKVIADESRALFDELRKKQKVSPAEKTLLGLERDYPAGDAGLFFFYLLNYFELHPGEAIFVDSQTPHAYLEGEVVECMANSDNVIRAGLTAKPCDVEAFLDVVRFEPVVPEKLRGKGSPWKLYRETLDFILERTEPSAIKASTAVAVQILFCLAGIGSLKGAGFDNSFAAGDAYLLPAGLGEYQLDATTADVFRVRVG